MISIMPTLTCSGSAELERAAPAMSAVVTDSLVLVELLPGPLEVVRRTAQVASEDLGLDPAGADLGDPDAVTQHVVAQLKRHAATRFWVDGPGGVAHRRGVVGTN